MGLFQTNWRTQAINLLPPILRSGTMSDFLSALVHPLQTDIDVNAFFDSDIRTKAKINGQIMVLAAGLNYIFGVTVAPFILISTYLNPTRLFSRNEIEIYAPFYSSNESILIPPSYSFNEADTVVETNFIVKIPIGIYSTDVNNQCRNYVNIFKLAGKNFTIQTY